MRPDPHSFFDPTQGRTKHVDLELAVDFSRKVISGTALLTFVEPLASGTIDFDTRGLTNLSVLDASHRELPFELGPEEPILGRRLRVRAPAGTSAIRIGWETSPEASALQWLAPEQTAGKSHPYLFSQCQAIHARSIFPVQDSPGARITYRAEVTVPRGLRALMSASSGGAPKDTGERTTWTFEMRLPIPPYLFALAVGAIEGKELTPRSRVWAETSVLDAAAWEFADTGKMMDAAEGLFGAYDWERFDLLVMPPSFPYGGMENPCLTFLTPTLIAGDRSLADVVAHELAHSWTGNLVSNASANDFWLNEGFTVYAERRITEALYGADLAALHSAVARIELDHDIARFGAGSPLTRLRNDLAGVDPDEVFSLIPYEKGYLFLVLLERTAGRPAFDGFLKSYLRQFRFRSITTADFEEAIEKALPGLLAKVDAKAWIDGAGVPANAPKFSAPALDRITTLAKGWPARPDPAVANGWTSNEWHLYLRALPERIELADAKWLDETFGLTARRNLEVCNAWLVVAAASGYAPARPRMREVLTSVGRMRYLKPLYRALAARKDSIDFAREVFAEAEKGYHAIAAAGVRQILAETKPG